MEQASRLAGKFPGVAIVIIPQGIIDGLLLEAAKATLLLRGRLFDIQVLLDYLIYLFFAGRDLQVPGIEEIEVGVEGHCPDEGCPDEGCPDDGGPFH